MGPVRVIVTASLPVPPSALAPRGEGDLGAVRPAEATPGLPGPPAPAAPGLVAVPPNLQAGSPAGPLPPSVPAVERPPDVSPADVPPEAEVESGFLNPFGMF